MPDMREVYDMVTKQTPPQADPLERQRRRQRSAARKRRIGAYVAVAAVLIVLAVAAVTISRAVQRNDVTPNGVGSGTPGNLTFLAQLPPGATPQKPGVVDLHGSQTSTIEDVPVDAYAPSITPDGTEMAFVAAPNEMGYNQVGLMHTDGTGSHFVPTPHIIVNTVAISPDGSRIALEGSVQGNTDIYVVNSDGTGLIRLTDDPATDQYPAWSPDGTTIAYDNAGAHEQDDAQFSKSAEIFTVAADGGSPTRITNNDGYDAAPSYSPDGGTIVDESYQGLSTMTPSGGQYGRLPISIENIFTPKFSPNGKTIAFSYYKDVPFRPTMQFGTDFGTRPIVIAALFDVATGTTTPLPHIAMASDANTPQWVDDQHFLAMRVPAGGV